jgi:hypothetical protein
MAPPAPTESNPATTNPTTATRIAFPTTNGTALHRVARSFEFYGKHEKHPLMMNRPEQPSSGSQVAA